MIGDSENLKGVIAQGNGIFKEDLVDTKERVWSRLLILLHEPEGNGHDLSTYTCPGQLFDRGSHLTME